VPVLWFSIAASVVLTVVLNLVLFLCPGLARRISNRLARLDEDSVQAPGSAAQQRVRVIFPWKAMLIGSLILTIAINLILLIRR
jgi:hypothetical protein